MKTLNVDGLELHYVERGSGDQTVVFSHSFLVDHRQFEAQVAALESRYRFIAYDHRDHGRSSSARQAYRLDDLVRDAIGVIEATGAAPATSADRRLGASSACDWPSAIGNCCAASS